MDPGPLARFLAKNHRDWAWAGAEPLSLGHRATRKSHWLWVGEESLGTEPGPAATQAGPGPDEVKRGNKIMPIVSRN